MKKVLVLIIFIPKILWAQNYVRMADSCLKLKDYVSAGINYDLYLKTDSESNGIAYRSAIAWSLANNKEKAFTSLRRYVKNNGINNNDFFSAEMLKEKSFDFIKDDPQWKALISSVQRNEGRIIEREKKLEAEAITNWKRFEATMDITSLLKELSLKDDIYFHLKELVYRSPKAYLVNNGIVLYIRKNDINVPFYVHFPENYDPSVPWPSMIVLHGGVRHQTGYGYVGKRPDIYQSTSNYIPYYSKNYVTIYPTGTAEINWMTTEAGFDMVNEILVHLKSCINIDDNRLELIGHSNGATGVFTYLVKSPTLYAGFYGMNTQPRVYIGGTYLKNGRNRHFYNFATDKDYYYPPKAIKTIDSLANAIGVRWQTQMNPGFPHWFPGSKESFQPMAKIFEDMATRIRDPFPKKIYLETDDTRYGTSDWIGITALDTLSVQAAWQRDPNFKITEWIDNSNFDMIDHREEMAFNFPHRSGAIQAERNGNNFYIETSDVAYFSIKLNRELIDYRKKVTIFLNNKKIYSQKIQPDKAYTLSNFKAQFDRKAIWENELTFKVSH